MTIKDQNRKLVKVVTSAPIITTLIVTPFFSYDPINVPRLFWLVIFSCICISLFLQGKKTYFTKAYVLTLILNFLFILWLSVSTIFSDMVLVDKIYGITGRQTGFITYFCLIILLTAATFAGSRNTNIGLIYGLLITGTTSAIYGLFQFLGYDPINWINDYSPVFGLFGNPNFHSSFMGITTITAFSLLLKQQNQIKTILIYGGFISLALLNVYQSKSQQGFLVLLVGVSIVLYLWLRSRSYRRLTFIYMTAWLIGALCVILDILQKTPWKSILYKESVSYRGDFWRAGWQMTLDNPIFGVGLDGYRDNYRFYRDQVATGRNPNAMVDSAHNIFIDISSAGGFPLLIIYLVILCLALISAVKIIKRSNTFDPIFAGVFGSWIAYLAQSLISINQIALAVWGWALTGAIIGYEIITKEEKQQPVVKRRNVGWPGVSSGVIIGVAITLPLFISDSQFRSTVKSGDVTQIQQTVEKWPQSVTRMTLAAKILREGGFADQALEISTKATKFFPNNFEAWQELYVNPKASGDFKLEALQMMKKLDPLNPNLG